MSQDIKNAAGDTTADEAENTSMVMSIFHEIIYSPMNIALVVVIAYLIYKIIKDRFEVPTANTNSAPPEPELPKLRRDFTIEELRNFDGNQPDGRVLVAVNGNIYDVTKGKRFYGPGGPYATFAGRDASRNLATFSVTPNDKDEIDDLSDLSAMEMESVREWEMQFKERYEYVGKLLRKGEEPTNYDEEENDDSTNASNEQKSTENKADETFTSGGGVAATDSKKQDKMLDEEGIRNRNVTKNSSTENEQKAA